MSYLFNIVYLLGLVATSPWLVYQSLTTGKYRRGLWSKLTGTTTHHVQRHPLCTTSPTAHHVTHGAPTVWFHGVSVGEIHMLRPLVGQFRRRHPDWECVISTTTDTGFDEARKKFPDLAIFYWPLDFSWAVCRALSQVNPSLVVLAEGEIWPNFLAAARQRGVPVAVVNGRMSPRSERRYRRLGFLLRRSLRQLELVAVQTEEYAACFRALGVDPERIHVTGSVKYDGVECDRDNARTQDLRRLLSVAADDLIWIAGSTQDPEEKIVLDIYRRAKAEHPKLRLFLVPRQKERFEEAARLLERSGLPFVRRSRIEDRGSRIEGNESVSDPPSSPSSILHPPSSIFHPPSSLILVDTIGELGALWGLADVAFVGGSLDGRRGGQNMIEPAAYGAAVVFGPHVWNFHDTAARLVKGRAAIQIEDEKTLDLAVRRLLADAAECKCLGENARKFALAQQGATERTLAALEPLMDRSSLARAG